MSRPHAVQTSWTPYPHPGTPVFRHAFALETFASGWHRGGPTLGGVGSTALGGWGSVSGITSWALPLPLETADLGGPFSSCLLPIWLSTPKGFCLVYPSAPSRGSPYASGCPASEDPLESAKAPGEKLLGPRARGQGTGGLRQVRAQVSPVSSRPVTPPADVKLHN